MFKVFMVNILRKKINYYVDNMRALQFGKFGNPIEVLNLEEVPQPIPNSNEVRIKMKFLPINPSDVYFIMGQYGIKTDLPAVPGFEGMGVIESVGSDITDLNVNTRVIPLGVRGTWQEYIIAPRNQLIIIPDRLKDESAAQLIVNPMTAWILANEELKLQKDQWLLQTAAGSTLGRIMIQISKLIGFNTINFVRRKEQVQELLDLGADIVICTKDKDVVDQVMKITKHGVDGAIDAVGGKTGALALNCLKIGGKLMVYGLLSLSNRTPIDTGEMIFKGTKIHGFLLTRWFQNSPIEKQSEIMQELIMSMVKGSIEPPVEAIYNIEDFKEAFELSTRSGRKGKILLKISS